MLQSPAKGLAPSRLQGAGGRLLQEPMMELMANSHTNSSTQQSPFRPKVAYPEPHVHL